MVRRLLVTVAGFALVLLACNATPDIPNDLKSTSPKLPDRGTSSGTASGGSEADNEGEPVLTGGRGNSPTNRPPPTDAGSGTPQTTDAGTTPVDSGTTTPPPPPPPPPPTGACAGTATQNACFQCCEQKNPGTVQEWSQFWDDCACAANRCGGVCAQSWCAGFYPKQGDACDNCLANVNNACNTQADAVCKQDATCAPLITCDESSGCLSKPK